MFFRHTRTQAVRVIRALVGCVALVTLFAAAAVPATASTQSVTEAFTETTSSVAEYQLYGAARASCKNVYSGSTRLAYVCVRADGLGNVYGTATRYVNGSTSLTLTECGGACPSRTTSISTINTSARTQSLSDRSPSYYYYTSYRITWYGHTTVAGYTNTI